MPLPILIEELSRLPEPTKRNLKETWVSFIIVLTVGIIIAFIVGLFMNVVSLDDKKCAAKYGAVEWDHQTVAGEGGGTAPVCVHTETKEQKPI